VNDNDIRTQVLAIIKSIAPEIDVAELRPDQPLRDQVDLDSMDWLNVILAAHEKFSVDIPEADYAKLRSLDDWVAYLGAKG
jgi:acyl carrier protein